ncbi:MAG TPA: ATP-binding protein [Actinomycetota bacterium]|nr:ATP-binding protein [Actinomycetota bacterium]
MDEGPEVAQAVPVPGPEGKLARRPWRLSLYLALVPIVVISGLVALIFLDTSVPQEIRTGFPLVFVLFLAEMFPIRIWRDIQVSPGFPTLMFIAALYQPAAVGLFALIGSGDPREFTGRSDFLRSVFNRAQVAAAGLAASAVFHGIAGEPRADGITLLAAAGAATAHMSVNMFLVGLAARLDYGIPLGQVLRRMPVGERWSFQAAYLGVGAVGAVLAVVYLQLGLWAAIGLALPLVAMRQLLKLARSLAKREEDLKREKLLQRATDEAALDRHREQERLASILHDEISPLISSLTVLLELSRRRFGEQDPELDDELASGLDAARRAQKQVRSVIGELLRPGPDPAGLRAALRELLDDLREEHSIAVKEEVEVIDAPAAITELLYGVAREAARNAVRHGSPRRLEVSLHEDEGAAILTVVDDGEGFDPESVPPAEDRFGLRLLRQRLETCGGSLSIRSAPGEGTAVLAKVPLSPGGSRPAG